jgi:Family of unknown function (DUF6496)
MSLLRGVTAHGDPDGPLQIDRSGSRSWPLTTLQRRETSWWNMPEQDVIRRARKDKRRGKSSGTQAGEFVREEMHHIREGKHGARSAKQAIAIGLSKARRAGVKLAVPKKGKVSARTRAQAKRDNRKGRRPGRRAVSRVRSRAVLRALRREGHSAASHRSLSAHARTVARQRSKRSRHKSAMKAARSRRKNRS